MYQKIFFLTDQIPVKGVAIFKEVEFITPQIFYGIIVAYKRNGFYVEIKREIRDGDVFGDGSGPATLYIHC